MNAVDSRRALFGDWGPVIRDPLDLLRLSFAVAAVVYGVLGLGGAVNLAVAAVAVIAVRFLTLPQPYDLAFIACMWLTGWGEALRLYDTFTYYDVLVHFLVPLLGAPIVYIALSRLDVVSEPREHEERHHYVGLFLVTLAFGLALGAAWEIAEWASDHVFGSKLQLGESDTIGDLVADGCGAAVGGALLVVWAAFAWGTVRRTPAYSAERR
jgi:hypothetical protein